MDGAIPRIREFGAGGAVCSGSYHDNRVRLAHRRVSHHPPFAVFTMRTCHDVTSLVAFAAGSTPIVLITEWFRTIRRRVVAAIAVLRGKAGALEPDDQESRRLARKLERANKKLEHALDMANRARSEAHKASRAAQTAWTRSAACWRRRSITSARSRRQPSLLCLPSPTGAASMCSWATRSGNSRPHTSINPNSSTSPR